MVNIFKKITIPSDYFNSYTNYYDVLKSDLYYYLYNNLQKENYVTFSWDLKTALKINANGEYI